MPEECVSSAIAEEHNINSLHLRLRSTCGLHSDALFLSFILKTGAIIKALKPEVFHILKLFSVLFIQL